MSWISDLDYLAMSGVLDFDAAAYVQGTAPRYTGNPLSVPFVPDMPKMSPFNVTPSSDEFINTDKKDNEIVKNSSWKKWAFGGTIAAALLYIIGRVAGFKIKMPACLKNLGTKISNLFKRGRSAGTPPPTP